LYYILRIQHLKYSIYVKKSNILKVIKCSYYIHDPVHHLKMLYSLMKLQAFNSEANANFTFIFYTICVCNQRRCNVCTLENFASNH